MDYATTPVAPRRAIRRLLPWTLAMTLFAGGGYGVYTYAVPQVGKATDTAADQATTADRTSPKPSIATNENVKQLFSSTPSPVQSSYSNRYTQAGAPPQLPPAQEPEQDEVATPRSAATLNSPPNPFATTPVSSYGDRYSLPAAAESKPANAADAPDSGASATPAVPISAPVAEPPQTASTLSTSAEQAAEQTEVTRGQEPTGENPLRAGSSRAPTSVPTNEQQTPADQDARAAFSDETSIVPPKPLAISATPRKSPEALGAQALRGSRYGADAAAQAFSAASNPPATNENTRLAAEPSLAEPTPAPSAVIPAPNAGIAPIPQQQHALAAQRAREPKAPMSAGVDASITPTPGLAATDGAGRPGERILEGLQNPAIAIQKLAPTEIQVGKKCTFAVRVQNSSQRAAHDVQIRDEVPMGTQLIGTAPKATVSGAQVVWDLGMLSAGEERIVEMELLPTDEGELGSVATVSYASQASAKVRCTRPELALRLTTTPRVMIGEQHLVEIEVTNPGTGDATGVMLLESVPAGVSHEAGPALEFEIGTLHPGETRRLDLVLTAEQAGRINNTMTARGDASLEVQASCEFEIIAPVLKVSVAGPKQRYLERPATYTVSVNNPGTAPAKEVQLVTQLPKGLQFVSADNYGEYDAATHSVRWSLAELPANEQGAVELTALPVEPGEHTLQIAGKAEQGLEDRTETRVMVEGLVALSFEVAAADGAIEVGGETSYDITVTNQGSKPAANVQVVAIVPAGLRATNGQGATRHVVQGDRIVFAPLAQLAPKAEAKFRVQVQGLRAGDQRTKIMVTADEVQEPITKEQGTLVYADQ
jgi:uncharacterized repeat protein (TIGR01451 family)